MSTTELDELKFNDEITVDSFVDTMKFQLDAFKDVVVTEYKLGAMEYYNWWEQFSAFLDSQSEGYGSVEDGD